MAGTPIEGLRRTWEAAAPGWAKWEPIWGRTLTHATEAMLDAAGVQPGMQVLDVACGAGSQTLYAASRVGPSGQVTATDISPTMLDHVHRTAIEAGLTNVDTAEGAAEELDLPAASFDAAICRLGVMLFADPAGAVRSVRAALKPSGRFAALVFTTPSNNPFMVTPMTVLLRHANAEPPAAGQPGLFAPGGHLSLWTYVGDDEHLRPTQAYGGHPVSYEAYLLSADRIAELLGQAGLIVTARLTQEPDEGTKRPHVCLLARKPAQP